MIILLLGKVVEACSVTLLRESDTLSCRDRKSLVPVWMMVWLGEPSLVTVNSSRAVLALGHQIFSALCLGNGVCSSRNFPQESIRRIMSALLSVGVCWVSVEGSGCDVAHAAAVVVSESEAGAGWV